MLVLPYLVQQKTTVPIPRLLDWSADPSNAIGSEYTISEHAAGTNLHFRWPDMTDYQRIECMENIYQRLKDVVEMEFPAYGSIYFADTRLAFATYNIDDTFVVGPHCSQGYWNCGSTSFHYHHSQANQGPCNYPTQLEQCESRNNHTIPYLQGRTYHPTATPKSTQAWRAYPLTPQPQIPRPNRPTTARYRHTSTFSAMPAPC